LIISAIIDIPQHSDGTNRGGAGEIGGGYSMNKLQIAHFITVIITILSAFWLWADHGYEPLIVCLGSISALAGFSFISWDHQIIKIVHPR